MISQLVLAVVPGISSRTTTRTTARTSFFMTMLLSGAGTDVAARDEKG